MCGRRVTNLLADLFQWVSTNNSTKHVGLVKSELHYLIKCNLFLPWYCSFDIEQQSLARNMNKSNNHQSSQIIDYKKTTRYENSYPGLGQAQLCGPVKPGTGIPTHPYW